jgi:hypothetical protein
MRTKHVFVPALDVGDLVPFLVRETESPSESIHEQKRARKELERFIARLEKSFKEKIYYMGMDIIGEKSYERFLFENSGFFEVMVESPLAMIAHFVKKDRAENFQRAFIKALTEVMPDTHLTKMFLESIEVQDESNQKLTVHKWNTMRNIRNS